MSLFRGLWSFKQLTLIVLHVQSFFPPKVHLRDQKVLELWFYGTLQRKGW